MTSANPVLPLWDDGAPSSLSPAARALRHDARGEWERAHILVQDEPDADSAWVHAYLHRREGDLANAGYWYRRAGRPAATGDLEAEREAIAAALAQNDAGQPSSRL